MPQDMPERISEYMPDRVPERMSEDMPDRTLGRSNACGGRYSNITTYKCHGGDHSK